MNQKITQKISSLIQYELMQQMKIWENEGQTDLDGRYVLTICEKIQKGDLNEYISIPIEYDKQDGGYLHVYGMRVKNWIKN